MFKLTIVALALLLLSTVAEASHAHLEKIYQEVWCNQHNGQLEYRLDDLSRVDCLTDEHAINLTLPRSGLNR